MGSTDRKGWARGRSSWQCRRAERRKGLFISRRLVGYNIPSLPFMGTKSILHPPSGFSTVGVLCCFVSGAHLGTLANNVCRAGAAEGCREKEMRQLQDHSLNSHMATSINFIVQV